MANNRPSRTCRSVGRVTAGLLLSFLALSSTSSVVAGESVGRVDILPQIPLPPAREGSSDGLGGGQGVLEATHTFTLRHIFHHGTHKHPNLHRRLDVPPDRELLATLDGSHEVPASPLVARSRAMSIQRLSDRRPSNVEPLLVAARANGVAVALSSSAWSLDRIAGPNVTDKETVISFARMAANAYVIEPNTGEWEDVGRGFNETGAFGWLGDGLRGHIFADETNSTIVIGLKGTSVAVFDGAETTTNDKINDNLFFGCCCAQGGNILWKQVCDCYTTTYTCNQTCVRKALLNENRYYRASLDLYKNVTSLYPNANVWLAGHSLGGSVSSLLGLTYGLPTLTYQAPGEALAATRIGIFSPPGTDPKALQTRKYTGAFHIGHNADPIFMGTCNGVTSACTVGGYAMETACHTGVRCVYNVVEDKGWRVSATTHRIHSVINDVLQTYDTVPSCEPDTECRDCANWEFFESNGTETTTSKTTTSTTARKTRTSTCKTPGWWGCLDESTTKTVPMTTITSRTTITTTSCKTPGWFGCKDAVTTTTTSTTTIAKPAPTASTTSPLPSPTSPPRSSSTCIHPGWFGSCNDIPETTSTTLAYSSAVTRTCATPGYFGGCKDRKTTPSTITSAPSTAPLGHAPTTTSHSCISREWFGLICVDPSPTSDIEPAETQPSETKGGCARRSWFGRCQKWQSGDNGDDTEAMIEWKPEI